MTEGRNGRGRRADRTETIADLRDAGPPLLALNDIAFSYGSLQVLFDVSISVWAGETLALVGANGAGKSTLLSLAAGLRIPDRGTVHLDAEIVTSLPAEERVRRGVVLVQGGRAVFGELSVEENLRIGMSMLGRDRVLCTSRMEETFSTFPILARRRAQSAASLSGGEQQMLGLGKALSLHPRVLLVDELSLGLAPVVVEQLMGILRQRHETGTTIILVEQSLSVAAEIADRAVYLEKGAVRFQGQAADLLDQRELAQAVFFGSRRAQP